MRWHCARLARLVGVVLVALAIAGCQSNGERDLIARDRRMREDQMWAMQDYLQQYQQLVCQFRSENASLRRQLNEERGGSTAEPGLQPTRQSPMGPPATFGAPQRQNTPPASNPNSTPAPAIESPDVPPLGQGTSLDSYDASQMLTDIAGDNRFAQLMSYESVGNNLSQTSGGLPSGSAAASRSQDLNSSNVLLSGEVVSNERGGGPRLVVNVQAFDESGRSARFDGDVSLALLASENGVQQRIARWDFGPNEVAAAVSAGATDHTMQFLVELPAGTKVAGPIELWAKLGPSSGSRLFSHAKLNLERPSKFSSRTDKVWAQEQPVVAASYVDRSAEESAATLDEPAQEPVTFNESEWSTAMPGQPAVLPIKPEQSDRGWRAASGQVPIISEKSEPKRGYERELPKPIQTPPAPVKAVPPKVAQKPSWTPERPGAVPQAARPAWSPTR